MAEAIQFHNAFILHTRPYRDTSLLVDFFTFEKGRLSAVVRGARRPKSPLKGLLQPFVPLLISWFGKNDLVTLKSADPNGVAHHLHGKWLMSGLYVNELLVRLLERHDPHHALFYAYEQVIYQLSNHDNIESHLRLFELTLLKELGYGVALDRVTTTDEPVEHDKFYRFSVEQGIMPFLEKNSANLSSGLPDTLPETLKSNLFLGKHLLEIHQQNLVESAVLKDAKRLLRRALQSLLGGRALNSRQLFIKTFTKPGRLG